ncbi:glycosyltransferase family 4 protein [Elioraea rosea]|uniref:glycosyltransferase family 4 protein n=1 Tax=Elioraea rosea TaxID=2492390 RepID=UPI001EF3E94B|nr:MraY family glycosyltransferase [Elioraea rosea]
MLPVTTHALLGHLAFCAMLALVSAIVVRGVIALRLMDVPNTRSAHERPTPKGGGLGIVVATLVGLSVLYLRADTARIADPYFIAVIGGGAAIAAVSLADDALDFSFYWKLVAQLFAAGLPIGFGLSLDRLFLPFVGEVPLGGAAIPFTLLWIVFVTNAMNFIDGLNGLCAGMAAIAAGFLAVIALSEGGSFVYAASLFLCAGCLGFLPFNFPSARIFLGDVGSQFIGYMLAILAVAAARFETTQVSFFIVPLLIAMPLFDVVFTLFRRALAGEGLIHAHRGHLYQMLDRTGYPRAGISLIHWGFTAAMGLVAFQFLRLTPPQKLILYLLVLAALTVYALWVSARARRAGIVNWSRTVQRPPIN